MSLNYNEEFMIDYLLDVTNYTIATIRSSAKNYAQLCQMYDRISKCMQEYPRVIYEYITTHDTEYDFTLEELQAMKYNDLCEIRNKLGLSSKGKRVGNVGQGLNEPLMDQITMFGDSKITPSPLTPPVAKAQVQIPNPVPSPTITPAKAPTPQITIGQSEDEEQFLTDEELKEMYGDEEYSDKELLKHGIRRENYHPDSVQDEEDEYYIMIDTIVDLRVSVAGHKLTFADCLSLEKSTIKTLYQLATSFIPKNDQKLKKKPKK